MYMCRCMHKNICMHKNMDVCIAMHTHTHPPPISHCPTPSAQRAWEQCYPSNKGHALSPDGTSK